MNAAGKIAIVGGTGLFAVWGIPKLFDLASKSSAGDKLILDVLDFNAGLQKITPPNILPKGLLFKIKFNIVNPSKQKLEFSKPFIKLSGTDKKGQKVDLGHSEVSGDNIKVPATGTKEISFTITTPMSTAFQFAPDIIQYMWGRLHGEKSSRKLLAEYTYLSEGFELGDKSAINL